MTGPAIQWHKKTGMKIHAHPGLPLPKDRKRILLTHKIKSEYRPSERKKEGMLTFLVIFG